MLKRVFLWIISLINIVLLCACNAIMPIDSLNENNKNKEYDYHQMYIDKDTGDLTDKELEAFNEAARVYELYIEDCDNDFEKVKAAHDYIIKNCIYNKEAIDKDILTEDDFSVYGVLVKGKGVCEGYAKTFKMFMDIAQIDCIIVTGTAGSENVSHAWNMVKLDNDWYHIDVTFDDPYPEIGEVVYLYLNVTDEIIKKDHNWNINVTPQADATIYDYVLMKGDIYTTDEQIADIIKNMESENITQSSFVWAGDKIISDEVWKKSISGTDILNLSYTYLGVEGRRLYLITLNY